MPPTCRAIVLLLMSTVLLSHSSSATIEDSVELLSDASNAQLSPNGAWSCCTKSGSCVQTSPSEPPSCAFDDDSSTRLTLAAGQRKATITVDLDPGAIIDYFEVSFDASGVMPSSVALTLFENDVTWTTYNNKSCQPKDRHLRKEGSIYFSCTPAGPFWNASVPEGLFSARNGSSGWLWWRTFTQLQLTIEANDADFNIQTVNNSTVITDILLYGWNQPTDVCNCHPVGVEIADNPCDSNRTCRCRVGTIGAQCIPTFFDAPRIYLNGSSSGGQTLSLQNSTIPRSYLQNITSVTIGNDYRCILSQINDTLISFKTVEINRWDVNWSFPIWFCWERTNGAESCLISNTYIAYILDPVVRNISPQVSIESGGITLTVTGENFYLATSPHVNVIVYSVFSQQTINVYNYSNRPYPKNHQDQICQFVNSTTMTCLTMPLDYDVKESRDYKMVIGIALGHSSYGSYIECGNACKPFLLSYNPTINTWPDDTKTYAVYDGRKTVEITGNGFEVGFGDEEYRVEVNGMPCEIAEVISNLILFYPPDISLLEDYTKKQGTVLYIGAYYSYTIGNLQYYKNWIDDPKHKNGLIGGLVGGILGFILIVVVIILSVFLYRRCRTKAGLLDSNNEARYTRTPGEHDGPVTEYLSDDVKAQVIKYTVPYERIELVHELGHGNFGKVFKGTLMDKDGVKRPVAIKSLHGVHLDIKDKVEFVEEAILMADFCHKHVLSLIAIIIEENVPYVVLPLMELGDLRTYVLQDGNSLNVGNLVNFCLEVAEGMEYLASRRFVHRDLAARNCMINKDKLVKVADFGLARDIFEKDYYRAKDTQRPLPVKWMAIECLSSNTEFTEKSDVWAYGVLVWELMTRGKRPYSDVDNLDLKRFLMQGRRLEKPPVAPDFIYDLMLRCWLPDRKNRPRFKDIVVELKEILMAAEESNATTHAAGEMNVAFDDGRVSYLQLSGNQRQ